MFGEDAGPSAELTQPTCLRCKELIFGEAIGAESHWLHPDCFRCFACNDPFPESVFYPHRGQEGASLKLLCEKDYAVHNAVQCAKCTRIITGKCLTALDRQWHPDCFTCDHCNKPLGSSVSVRPSGKYCKACLPMVRAEDNKAQRETAQKVPLAATQGTSSEKKCQKCAKPFLAFADIVHFNEQPMHAYHFTCALCKKEVDRYGKQFDEDMYCAQCYVKVSNAICAACGQQIAGRSVTAMGLQFHPEHFVCVKCLKPFPGGEYFELEGEPFCKQHYHEECGQLCGRCFQGPTGQVIVALGRKWCEGHLRCYGCDKDVARNTEKNKFVDCDTRPYCHRCYDTLPFSTRKKLVKYETTDRKAKKLQMKAMATAQ